MLSISALAALILVFRVSWWFYLHPGSRVPLLSITVDFLSDLVFCTSCQHRLSVIFSRVLTVMMTTPMMMAWLAGWMYGEINA